MTKKNNSLISNHQIPDSNKKNIPQKIGKAIVGLKNIISHELSLRKEKNEVTKQFMQENLSLPERVFSTMTVGTTSILSVLLPHITSHGIGVIIQDPAMSMEFWNFIKSFIKVLEASPEMITNPQLLLERIKNTQLHDVIKTFLPSFHYKGTAWLVADLLTYILYFTVIKDMKKHRGLNTSQQIELDHKLKTIEIEKEWEKEIEKINTEVRNQIRMKSD